MATEIGKISENARIEKNTIFPISPNIRHGKPFDLFTLWFGANLSLLTITPGIISTENSGYGLPFVYAMIAIIVGTAVGAIFVALHSAQGSHLGISQMQQSRAQFGSFGALPILVLIVFMYIGYFASNIDVGEQAILAIIPGIGKYYGYFIIIGFSILSFMLAYIGYDIIHKYAKVVVFFAISSLLVFMLSLIDFNISVIHLSISKFSLVNFMSVLGMAAIWQISWAPFVSDYSRYLPKKTGQRVAFWTTYLGNSIGAIVSMTIGALIGTTNFSTLSNGFGIFPEVFGVIGVFFILSWSLSVVEGGALQLYCASLTSISIIQTFFSNLKPSRMYRLVVILLITSVSLGISLLATSEFMMLFMNFIYFLLYVLVPWSVINLVDYYLVHDGHYHIESFYVKGGKFGYVNKRAAISYVFGFIIEIPFMSNAIYTGPIAYLLGGADISWIVSSPVIAIFYYIISRNSVTSPSRARLADIFGREK